MFTGIIQQLGRVTAVKPADFGASLWVDAHGWQHRPSVGDSIAVNGCCLTAAQEPDIGPNHQLLAFDVIKHTLEVTTLADLRPEDQVNLEHAVTPQTMLGGHIVQGHVDCTGTVIEHAHIASNVRLRIEPSDSRPQIAACILERGSIAVNGVALTVSRTGNRWFEVELIPTTLQRTNLGALQRGAKVNLETDYVAKIVANWMGRFGTK